MQNKPIQIGLIGFGNVGSGVVKVLQENARLIEAHAGVPLQLKKIADPDLKRPRPVEVNHSLLTSDAREIINDPEIKIVVEAIGGVEPARTLILEAIQKGKHVVTPNKEVVAQHGAEILEAALKNKVNVLFEGAVGGGIPIILPLTQSLAANHIEEIYGIVNGTTNYILSKMTEEKKEFEAALCETQKMGYAEADPSKDINGYDAACKALILAAVAFGVNIPWNKVYYEGISKVTLEDIEYAREIGYVIKLLAVAKKTPDGIEVRVHPTLVPNNHPLSSVSEAFNAIYVKGDMVGELMFYGQGAGGVPTASAVVADAVEIAEHLAQNVLAPQPNFHSEAKIKPIGETLSRYYIRLKAPDRPGVLASISGVFGEKGVSIAAALQKETVKEIATIVIILHRVRQKNLQEALAIIEKLPTIIEISNVIRVGLE